MCRIKFNEDNIKSMEDFWNDILANYNEKIKDDTQTFKARIISGNSDKYVDVVLQKNNIYVIGIERNGKVEKFNKTTYVGSVPYEDITQQRINDLVNALQKEKSISKISDKDVLLMAFIISEAARFSFVRAVIKRVYGASEQDLHGQFINWENTQYCYNKLECFDLLLNNYSHLRKYVESNNNKKHVIEKCIGVFETQKYFYNDAQNGSNALENYNGLIHIGLLKKGEVEENYSKRKPKKDIITAK